MSTNTHDLTAFHKDHSFHEGNAPGERNTWRVVVLSAITMVLEIVAGNWFGSLALTADGWHMGTHVAALGITVLSYYLARRYAKDPRFSFGTWKMEVLGGFASALVLGLVSLFIVWEAAERFVHPLEKIDYNEALGVAVLGLLVNLGSALLLGHGHEHEHGPGAACGGESSQKARKPEHDINLRAAYVHVLADALTSVLAIGALLGGKIWGWNWLDPAMGLVGAVVIAVWSIGLLRETSRILLDREMDHPLVDEIRTALERGGEAQITDLHLWRVGRTKYACMVSLVICRPITVEELKERLALHQELIHVTIELHNCPEHVNP